MCSSRCPFPLGIFGLLTPIVLQVLCLPCKVSLDPINLSVNIQTSSSSSSLLGFGNLAAAIVAVVVNIAYKPQILNDSPNDYSGIDASRRLLFGLGAVPAAIALYFRLTFPETPRYKIDVERQVAQTTWEVDRYLQCVLNGGPI